MQAFPEGILPPTWEHITVEHMGHWNHRRCSFVSFLTSCCRDAHVLRKLCTTDLRMCPLLINTWPWHIWCLSFGQRSISTLSCTHVCNSWWCFAVTPPGHPAEGWYIHWQGFAQHVFAVPWPSALLKFKVIPFANVCQNIVAFGSHWWVCTMRHGGTSTSRKLVPFAHLLCSSTACLCLLNRSWPSTDIDPEDIPGQLMEVFLHMLPWGRSRQQTVKNIAEQQGLEHTKASIFKHDVSPKKEGILKNIESKEWHQYGLLQTAMKRVGKSGQTDALWTRSVQCKLIFKMDPGHSWCGIQRPNP